MMRFSLTALALTTLFLMLGGCSSTKLYRADLPQNLTVNTSTESVKTALHIYSVHNCQTSYQGTVELNRGSQRLGIPEGKPTYLTITFASSSFWRGSNSQMSHDTLLLARKGYSYELGVSYRDNIYNVVLYEVDPRSGRKREMEMIGLSGCRGQ